MAKAGKLQPIFEHMSKVRTAPKVYASEDTLFSEVIFLD